MRCRTARRSLFAARDGELAAAEREALEAHLSACEACRGLAGETARLHRALAAMPQSSELPPGLAEATLRRVRAEAAEETPGRGVWWWMAAPLAAGLAGVAVWRTWPAPGTAPEPPAVAVPERPAVATRPAEPAAPASRQLASKPAPAPAPAPASAADAPEPPPQVAEALDLYLDMPILENLEKLQNYDAIRTVDIGDERNGSDRRG